MIRGLQFATCAAIIYVSWKQKLHAFRLLLLHVGASWLYDDQIIYLLLNCCLTKWKSTTNSGNKSLISKIIGAWGLL